MTRTGSGILCSLAVHGAILLLGAVLSTHAIKERRAVSIDLGLLKSIGKRSAPASTRENAPQRPAVQPDAASDNAVPSPEQEMPLPPAPPVVTQEASGPASDRGTAGDGSSPSDVQGLRDSYLNEYLVHIRDRIVQNIFFPPAARRMGWSGRMIVSFVICRNGKVEKIRIVHTTGHEVLDRNVLEAIRRTAPFPRPPMESEVTVPIVFKLL